MLNMTRFGFLSVSALLICSVLTGIASIPTATAAPVTYNTSMFTPPSLTGITFAARGFFLDTDGNGIIDSIYEQSSSSTQYVWTLRAGVGITPITYNVPVGWVLAASATYTIPDQQYLYFMEVNLTSHDMELVRVNVLTGASAIVAGPYNNANIVTSYQGGSGFITKGGAYAMAGAFQGIVTNVWYNGTNNAVITTTGLVITPYILGINSSGGAGAPRMVDYADNVITTILPAGMTDGRGIGHCGDSGCLYKDGSTYTAQGTGLTTINMKGPRDMALIAYGVDMPHGRTNYYNKPTYWADIMTKPDVTDTQALALRLHPIYYGLGTSPLRFIYENGGNTYLALITSSTTVQYALISGYTSQFTNRHFEFIAPDLVPSTSVSLRAIGSALTSAPHSVIAPDGTRTLYSVITGAYILMSGYKITHQTGTLENHYIEVSWLNYNSTVYYNSNTGATFEMVIQVRGISNTDYALKLEDTNPITGSKYFIWMERELQSDKTIAVDVTADACYNISIRDISTELSSWDSIGNLCGNGSSVKSVTYISNIAFTFWSLPWGATHRFNATTTILDTMVRHNSVPFNYDVIVKDNTEATILTQHYTSATELDTQTNNLTAFPNAPYKLYIYDNSTSRQIYTTYLDENPKYLTSIKTFFEDYTTFAGWNMLFFMPIIFAAMFTRNTVGIGTVLTVLMLGVLNWLGIIDLPDELILLLIFIAIIGLVAYRILY